ncbi:glia maturation factor gamma isoform X2 [Psammomys obesus]|uniref:glia maturation factor gamma isoform X2 n=1 Tax=Psammomys obesus TaxID=48139 RepID=UPI002452C4E0|nr:glia maturation factor gamma isoform X2 [Psammomys obesus]
MPSSSRVPHMSDCQPAGPTAGIGKWEPAPLHLPCLLSWVPALRMNRFVLYSYKYEHADGRVSYPLCFIFSSPVGCKPEQQMMYAGSKNWLVQTAELTKVFEIRTTDDLTEAWLKEKLAFFR